MNTGFNLKQKIPQLNMFFFLMFSVEKKTHEEVKEKAKEDEGEVCILNLFVYI